MKYEKVVIILGVNNVASFLLFIILLQFDIWIGLPLIFFFLMLIGIVLIVFLIIKNNKEMNKNWKSAPKEKKDYYYYGGSSSKSDSNRTSSKKDFDPSIDSVFYKEAVKFYGKNYSKRYSKQDLINKYMDDTKR